MLGQLDRTATGDDPVNAPTTVTEYTYDRLGRLKTVTATWRDGVDIVDEITAYQYDAVGSLDKISRPGAIVTDFDYDDLNRLTYEVNFVDSNADDTFNGADTLLSDFTYTLRDDGRRIAAVEQLFDSTATRIQTFTWDYDNAGRLIEETLVSTDLDDYTDTFAYDLVGNRLQYVHDSAVNADDKTVTYTYDDNDRLLVETKYSDLTNTNVATTTLYEYGNGANPVAGIGGDATQQTKKTVWQGADTNPGTGTKLGETVHTYNLQGRLSQVEIDEDANTNPGIDTTTDYEYNDAGIRVAQSVNGVKTLLLIDENNHTGYAQILEEIAAVGGALLKSYLLGHDVLSQYESVNGMLQLLSDGHGSTRQLVDALGAPIAPGGTPQIYTYNAYGELLQFASTPLTTLLYSGEQSDLATGLQYLRARFYDPRTGRFNRLDPFAGNIDDPQSLHKYLYAHVDPIDRIDPSGLESLATFSAGFSIAAMVSALSSPAVIAAAKFIGVSIGGIAAIYGISLLLATDTAVVTTGQLSEQLLQEIVDRLSQVAVDTAVTAGILEEILKKSRYVYFHYSDIVFAPSLLAKGLVRSPGKTHGPWATRDIYLSGSDARLYLALPRNLPPDALYFVKPSQANLPIGPFIVNPLDYGPTGEHLPGGGTEYEFTSGTSGGTGTVFGPVPII